MYLQLRHYVLLLYIRKRSRAIALNCINAFLLCRSEVLQRFIDPFLASLFQLANDADQEVQKQLCRALTFLLDSYMDQLTPYLNNIVEFMIMRTQVWCCEFVSYLMLFCVKIQLFFQPKRTPTTEQPWRRASSG